MANNLGDFATSTVIYGKFTTVQSTGAPSTLGGTPALSVYKNNSTTQSTSGVTLTADFDSVTGLNHFTIDTSSDGTFYSAGAFFDIIITTGTVNSVSAVGYCVGQFTLSADSALKPTTAGRTLDVTATGAAGIDWSNIENQSTSVNLSATTTNLVNTATTVTNQLTAAAIATGVWQDATSGDFTVASSIGKSLYTGNVVPGAAGGHFIAGTNAATTVTTSFTTTFTGNLTGSVGSVTGAVGSVTGAVGSVTGNVGGNVTGSVGSVSGNVGGNVTGSVGSVASGGISRASFSADSGLQTTRSNTAQAGGSTTITLDASASATNDIYKEQVVYLTGGTGAGQVRVITGYVGSTKIATVTPAWATNPDNTSTFAVMPYGPADVEAIKGAATAGAAGYAGIDWGNINAPTSTVNLSNTTIATVSGQLTAAAVATAVWQDTTSGDFTVASSIGKSLYTGGVVPGGTNGLFIAGTNAATSITSGLTANITGNLSGSVGSVTARVTANVDQIDGSAWSTHASGMAPADLRDISGAAVSTSTAQLGVNIVNIKGTASAGTAGYMGLDWSTINAPTTSQNLSGTTISTSQAVASVTGAVGSVTGNVGGNVTGTIGGLTAAALADFFTVDSGKTWTDAIAGSVVGETSNGTWDVTLSGHLTSGSTGFALNAAGSAGDPWSTALPGAYGAGTAGYIVGNNLDAAITSRMATYTQPTGFLAATFPSGTIANTTNITAGTITTVTNLTNAPTNGDLTATMKASVTTAATAATPTAAAVTGNVGGNVVGTVGGMTAAGLAEFFTTDTTKTFSDAVAGSVVYEIAENAGGSGSDPWATALPGSYAAGQAGYIVGTNLDATVSSRLPTSSYTAPDNADIAAIKAKTDNLPASPAAVGSAMTLTSAYDFAKGTVAMTESYAANGVAPTPVQALMAIHQDSMSFDISGTAYTVHQLDNTTPAFVKTLNDATSPTAVERA